MWFKNIIVYQIISDIDFDEATLNDGLIEHHLKPCPSHARHSMGWVSPFPQQDMLMAHTLEGCHLIVAAKEERLLPTGVIRAHLANKIEQIETSEHRKVKRAEKLQLKEDLEFELLPKAFTINKLTHAYIDTRKQWLIINSSSSNKAADVLALLRKALDKFEVEPLPLNQSLEFIMTQWVNGNSLLPSGFALGKHCELKSADDEPTHFNCKNVELPSVEIDTLLKEGMYVSSIELIWQDRIQFTLSKDFVIKRMKCLEYLKDAFVESEKLDDQNAKLDANLALLIGELRVFITDIYSAVNDIAAQICHPEFSEGSPTFSGHYPGENPSLPSG